MLSQPGKFSQLSNQRLEDAGNAGARRHYPHHLTDPHLSIIHRPLLSSRYEDLLRTVELIETSVALFGSIHLFMGALHRDAALLHEENPVHLLHAAQMMGDPDDGLAGQSMM